MIEPYDSVINSLLNAFSNNGFSKIAESDYSVAFSNSDYTVEIVTEQYDHPSVSSHILDKNGGIYSIWLLREILEPNKNREDIAALNAIKKQYDLDQGNLDNAARQQGLTAYVSLCITQLINFLMLNNAALISGSFKAQYSIREEQALRELRKS